MYMYIEILCEAESLGAFLIRISFSHAERIQGAANTLIWETIDGRLYISYKWHLLTIYGKHNLKPLSGCGTLKCTFESYESLLSFMLMCHKWANFNGECPTFFYTRQLKFSLPFLVGWGKLKKESILPGYYMWFPDSVKFWK